jgi:hypothetical protein
MKGIWAPGAVSALLALLGAAGIGPPAGGEFPAVVVDTSPSCEAPPLPPGAVPCPDSRLGAALFEAARGDPPRIRLYTDGCDLSGRAPEPPPIPVDVTLLPRSDHLRLLRVRAADRIPKGLDFAVEIVVGRTAGRPRAPVVAAVDLYRDGERVGAGPTLVRMERGATARVLVRDRVGREGVVRYRALVADASGQVPGDGADALARIGEEPLVLAVGGPLAAPGMRVVEVAPAEVLAAPLDLADAVLVRALPDAAGQERIADAVRTGAGLVLLGGGGVGGRPLEPVLPLTDAPPQGRAALLLLDFSGSMQELKESLLDAVGRLLQTFAPDDRVAFVAFRDRPVAGSPWQRAADARWDLRALAPHGNTRLLPALREAERLLAEAQGEPRLFVVSDGKWGDRDDPELARLLHGLGAVHRAALFVRDDVPAEAKALFPVSVTEREDLAAALERLEAAAEDRTVAAADAAQLPAPAWLEGAVPAAGTYHEFVRLYPRRVGESVVLAARGIPVAAAWRPGGKVVMAAPEGVDAAPLVRAVLRDTGGVRLDAWRDGDGLVAQANGSGGAAFVVAGATVPARPVARDRFRARVPRAPAGEIVVSCGGATRIVPGAGARELVGLGNRPDIAAAIARASGGALVEEGGAGGEERTRPAAFVTLLLAAALVVLSAWRRRGA